MNFLRSEFKCKCGCGLDTVDFELLQICQVVRDLVDMPVVVSSGYRCPTHNKQVGGEERSQHLFGRAADLKVENPKAVFDYLCRRFVGQYGFGVYDTFVHVDTRSGNASRWDRRTNGN